MSKEMGIRQWNYIEKVITD